MIGVVGGGAFGTALAVTLARDGSDVVLWTRDKNSFAGGVMARLLGVELPGNVSVTANINDLLVADPLLVAVPMQALTGFLNLHGARMHGRVLVACCKGVDLVTGRGATAVISAACPTAKPALLTGPSFAADIARGLPTALTIACTDDALGEKLQRCLSTAALRLYRSTDVIGAELGGALKNVIAIASGVVMGAGLGESARAALMTRGYAEMQRYAMASGARAETLAGLSGLGDLVLTCTSDQSRNFRYGRALGAGLSFDPGMTVEGVATAKAVSALALKRCIEMPIATMVAALVENSITLPQAIQALLSRPLKQE